MKSKVISLTAGFLFSLAIVSPVLAQVSNFDALNGYAAGVEARLAKARNSILRLGPADSASGLIVSAGYLDRQIDAASDSIERSTDGGGASVGYNWKNADWNFGVSFGADSTTSDYNEVNSPAPTPLHGSVEAKSVDGSVWAGVNFGQSRLTFFGSVGKTSNEGTRVSDAGSSFADYDSSDAAFGVQFSYNLSLSESVALQPFLGISTASADTDGFTERGTSPDRRILRDFKMRETRGAIGARIAGKQATWVPSATLAWLSRFSGGDTSISNSAINGSNLGIGLVPEASSGLFFIGAGISGALSDKLASTLEVQYFTGGDEQQLGLNASLRYSF